jgi:hypothetical protein
VGDDAAEYRCFTCYGETRFFRCPECSAVQTVNARWRAFTCGRCDRRVDLPQRWTYSPEMKAIVVSATGYPFPKL